MLYPKFRCNDTMMFPIGEQHFSTLDLVEFRSICQGKHHHSVEDFLTLCKVGFAIKDYLRPLFLCSLSSMTAWDD